MRRPLPAALTVLAGLVVAPTAPAAAAPTADGPCQAGRTRFVADPPPALGRLSADRAARIATGAGVTVAVVDTGVAAGNPHFPDGTVLPGRSVVGGSATTDDALHGTAVAGLVAARPLGERSGVRGLAPAARILPVKVVPDGASDPDTAEPSALAAGIRWAADQGAEVIAVSPSTTRDDPALRSAVAGARRAGALVVAAVGPATSAGQDRPAGARYPAAYPGVLGVAATDGDDAATGLRGPQVDLAAPGVEVVTTFGAWGDCVLTARDGASGYAAGYAAAAAALLAQRFPDAGPDEWAHRLTATASRQRRPARDDAVGWGVVQPVEALTAVLDASVPGPPPPGADAPDDPAPTPRLVAAPEVADPGAEDRRRVVWLGLTATTLLLALALLRQGRRTRAGDRPRPPRTGRNPGEPRVGGL